VDIDREICKQNDWFNKLNQGYRRRCITKNINSVGYVVNSKGSHGKTTYKLVENRDALREKLVSIVSCGGTCRGMTI
jgi:hypothetical protein